MPARLRQALAGFALTLAAQGVTGCPDSGRCEGEETVNVKMTGTCATGTQTFQLYRSGCTVRVVNLASDGGAPASLGLPPTGELTRPESTLRQGDWSLWGCTVGQEPCPDQFRVCTAVRAGFQLNLTCLGGTGAPACNAVLVE